MSMSNIYPQYMYSATKLKPTKTPTDILKALLTFLTNSFKLKLVWALYGYVIKKKIF